MAFPILMGGLIGFFVGVVLCAVALEVPDTRERDRKEAHEALMRNIYTATDDACKLCQFSDELNSAFVGIYAFVLCEKADGVLCDADLTLVYNYMKEKIKERENSHENQDNSCKL